MGENKDKNIHGANAKEALGQMLESMKENDFVSKVEVNYSIGDSEFSKEDQFKATYLVEFLDEEQWAFFSTTSIRDRMKQNEWDALNIKRLNEYVKKAYVVIPDGVKDEERKNALRYDSEIKEHIRFSVLDGVGTLDTTANLIKNKGSQLLAYGSGWAKKGNEFEEKIVKTLSSKQNFEKWVHNSKLTDGYFYPLFLMIVEKLQLNSNEVEEITAMTEVPSLATGGKAKTDVIVYAKTRNEVKKFTISCKSTYKKVVSVNEYKPERYALILNEEDEELRELLIAFRDAGGIKAYSETEALTEKMKIYGDALAEWRVGGIGDPNLTEPELQCAEYIISYNEMEEKYSMHELKEYIELCKQDEENGGHYGTIFRWTRKSNNIQLKMKLL